MYLSIVSPVYKAEGIVQELVRRIENAVSQFTNEYEIILVEDCGGDRSWEIIENIARTNSKVKGIKLSKNYGQHYAITAGLDVCSGEWTVVMDCDLQDQPEEIKTMLNAAEKGYDIVFARRVNRQDGFFKRMSSKLFYLGFSYLSDIQQDGTISNFGIFSRKAVDAVNSMREPMRAFSPMMRWVGFEKFYVDVAHAPRHSGKSSYNWTRLINLALDISLAYSDKPLRLTVQLGFMIAFLSGLATIVMICIYALGYAANFIEIVVIASLWFLSGLIIFTLGIVGLYIGKIFDSVKNRPLYFVDKKVNITNK